jgi:cytochrome c oxidase subunit 2
MNWIRTLTLPLEASTTARDIDNLYIFIVILSAFFFLLVAGLTGLFVLNYRRKGPGEVTPHITHHFKLEVFWSVAPLLLCLVIFFWGFRGFITANVPPAEAMEIQVSAKKWVWSFEYPDGTRTINDIHVPIGKPVRLVMQSEDVIHSFFVPDFRIKHDVLPNRYTEIWFQPTKIGPHQVFCTEYCGKGHSDMLAKIWVDDDATYQKWVIEGPPELKTMPLVDLGKMVYENKGCATCHSLDGSRGQGPSWKGIYGRPEAMNDGTSIMVDDNYVRESILDPQKHIVRGFEGIMPTFQGLLRPREIDGTIAYIKSLK